MEEDFKDEDYELLAKIELEQEIQDYYEQIFYLNGD